MLKIRAKKGLKTSQNRGLKRTQKEGQNPRGYQGVHRCLVEKQCEIVEKYCILVWKISQNYTLKFTLKKYEIFTKKFKKKYFYHEKCEKWKKCTGCHIENMPELRGKKTGGLRGRCLKVPIFTVFDEIREKYRKLV